jgi:hypothetical protein
MLSDREIAAIIRTEISNGDGGETSQTSLDRAQALNYFFNRPRGDELPGRSSVQATDVSDMVEALMAQMTPMLTKETLVRFEAAGEEDENAAQEETEFVRYLIGASTENYLEVTSAVKDSLMLKNGWIHVYVDVEEWNESYTRKNIAEFQIQKETEQSNNEESIKVTNIEDSKDGEGFDVSFKRFVHKRRLVIQSVAPENMIWSEDHSRQDLEGIRLLAERKYLTRSELRKLDYPAAVVDKLASTEPSLGANSARRNQGGQQSSLNSADSSQEFVETWVVHAHLDIDEKGIAHLWRIHYADAEILKKEKVDWVPYATGCPFPTPHRLDGQSIYDKLKQNQDMGTGIYRLFMDNVALMNRPRLVYNPNRTEEDDVLNARPGGGIRSKDPMQGVSQLQTNDMGGPLISAMQWLDSKRSERAGASLDLHAADLQLAGHNIGQQGAERQIALKEMLAGHMTANLANTLFKNMFLLVHKTVREYMPGELNAKIAGKWLQTDATQWQERKKVLVATGLTQTEKGVRMSTLSAVIQQATAMIQQGQEGILADKPGLYNALMDWCRAANLSNPEQYWVDPESEGAQQAMQQQQEQQAQQAEQAKEMQQMQMDIFTLQQQLEKYKTDSELLYKYRTDALDAEIEEAKIVGQATLDLQREQRSFTEAGDRQAAASMAGSTPPGAPDPQQAGGAPGA